ncbi:hypothetical protein BY996DRAFT_6414042 [Phakopsora pachyrhizi]|nr:hypothetical protein BY996DRAFT_6414042 [Phakopsora pachyrhizi]
MDTNQDDSISSIDPSGVVKADDGLNGNLDEQLKFRSSEKLVDTTDIGTSETEVRKVTGPQTKEERIGGEERTKDDCAKQIELAKNQLEDKLNTDLSHRPEPEELVKAGILTGKIYNKSNYQIHLIVSRKEDREEFKKP